MPSGGDLKEFTWNNGVVGSGRCFSKEGETHSIVLGGLMTNDDDANLDSGGNFINEMSAIPWSYEATMVFDEMNSNRMEIETLQAIINSQANGTQTTMTFTNRNNITYTGVGMLVGKIQGDRQKSTFSFKAMGGGILQQV
jgi:hypothetical protein